MRNLFVVLCHVEITEFREQTQDTSDLYEVKGSNEQISYLGQSRDKAMCFCCEVTSRFDIEPISELASLYPGSGAALS